MALISLCQTILEPTYAVTVDFANKGEQDYYFTGSNAVSLTTNANVKADAFRETITVDFSIDELMKYDYIIITDDYQSKSYFYFILKKEMRTKGSSILTLKLDVFQTYMFDYKLGECFVERCHVPRWDDGIPTDNNLDEELEYGPTIVKKIENVAKIEDNYIICATTPIGKLQQGGGSSDGGGSGSVTGGGNPSEGKGSNSLIRYIKGWEGFSAVPYNDSGGVPTVGYGITGSEPDLWDKLKPFPCSEKDATLVLIEAIQTRYGISLANQMKADGIDLSNVKQQWFDAFLDLCYNGGLGAVTKSPMYKRFKEQPGDPSNADGWESWYIRDNVGNVLEGLISRRKDEKNMFLNGTYNKRPIQNLQGGYVDGDGYLPMTETGEIGEALVNSARKLIGKPYVWGGNYPPLGSDKGTDCSGLMQWAFNDNGRKITRTTYTQIKQGKEIKQSDVALGDLIFSNFSSPESPEHVYMYAGMKDGKHMCVEAPRTGLNIRERSFDFVPSMRVRRLI